MRKYFQFAAWLVVTMLGACSGGTESKEAADTAMEDKPVVRLASVTSRDVDQIEEYTATVEAEAKNNIAPTSPGRIDRIFVEVGDPCIQRTEISTDGCGKSETNEIAIRK